MNSTDDGTSLDLHTFCRKIYEETGGATPALRQAYEKYKEEEMKPTDDELEALAENQIHKWPPIKKCLWDVVVGENLNDGHYINAYDLTEKLHAAMLRACKGQPAPDHSEWQPIETAPKAGLIDIWLSDGLRWCDCYYDPITDTWRRVSRGKLLSIRAEFVTHWMPRPKPPAQERTRP